jgi:manganese transport protein
VILLSSLMAVFLQTLCVRLGIATGRDLAQSCREHFKRPVAVALWLVCEIAIIACDLAEVIGSAVALQLLFHIPLVWGVIITGADVLLLLGLMRFGFRVVEATIVTLVATISACFAYEIYLSRPGLGPVAHGMLVPSLPNSEAVLIAVAILGATVMPHNLYLHSSIVQTRAFDQGEEGRREAIRNATADTVIALGLAFFVNAAILVLAGAVFFKSGIIVEELQQAHKLLSPVLGGAAATLFAVALLASGQSSTMTGTLAGQIVMEGFLNIQIAPWIRRLVTRCLAIIPAVLIISALGSRGTVGVLLISQVILSMQLPFAVVPLLIFTSSKVRMGAFANPSWAVLVGWAVCVAILGLNAYLLEQVIGFAWLAGILVAIGGFAAWVRFAYKAPASVAS